MLQVGEQFNAHTLSHSDSNVWKYNHEASNSDSESNKIIRVDNSDDNLHLAAPPSYQSLTNNHKSTSLHSDSIQQKATADPYRIEESVLLFEPGSEGQKESGIQEFSDINEFRWEEANQGFGKDVESFSFNRPDLSLSSGDSSQTQPNVKWIGQDHVNNGIKMTECDLEPTNAPALDQLSTFLKKADNAVNNEDISAVEHDSWIFISIPGAITGHPGPALEPTTNANEVVDEMSGRCGNNSEERMTDAKLESSLGPGSHSQTIPPSQNKNFNKEVLGGTLDDADTTLETPPPTPNDKHNFNPSTLPVPQEDLKYQNIIQKGENNSTDALDLVQDLRYF